MQIFEAKVLHHNLLFCSQLRHPGKCGRHLSGIQERIMNKAFCVYILASKQNGTLYVGVTSDLIKRIWQHKKGVADGFTKKYGVKKLVYYEQHENAESAIHREKQLKKWKRQWKLELIKKVNAKWDDLYDSLLV